jgi:hypothetical protein
MDDRRRAYAEWYVWSARNLTTSVEIKHACAEAAAEAASTGGDPAAAARAAAQNRSGPGWTTHADPGIRSYAEWYDWSRTTLGLSGEAIHTSAAAAIEAMDAGADATGAADAARGTVSGAGDSAVAGQPGPPAPPPLPPVAPPPYVAQVPTYAAQPPPSPPAPAAPPVYQPGPPPPPAYPPAAYGYAGGPYQAVAPPPATGPIQVPIWATVILGIGCGISFFLGLSYLIVLTDRATTQDLVVFATIALVISILMFVTSLVALIGIIRRAGWGRVMAIVAGAFFCVSCVGILLGVPVIIGAATAKRAPAQGY